MSPRKISLHERLASGEIKLPTEAEVKANPNYSDGIEATLRFMEETRTDALSAPRKPGRPSKTAARRQTEVRSLRLEISLWGELEIRADHKGYSVNRLIEEAILEKLGYMGAQNDLFDEISLDDYTAEETYKQPKQHYSTILTFQPAAA